MHSTAMLVVPSVLSAATQVVGVRNRRQQRTRPWHPAKWWIPVSPPGTSRRAGCLRVAQAVDNADSLLGASAGVRAVPDDLLELFGKAPDPCQRPEVRHGLAGVPAVAPSAVSPAHSLVVAACSGRRPMTPRGDRGVDVTAPQHDWWPTGDRVGRHEPCADARGGAGSARRRSQFQRNHHVEKSSRQTRQHRSRRRRRPRTRAQRQNER